MSSKNKAKNLSDLARNNQTAMFAHTVEVSVMTVFCLLQALIGMQTFGYILIIVLLGFAPVIAERIAWARNKETPFIKHSVAIGFAIFYTFTLFTSTNLLVFVFVVPMILVISIYNDTRYSLIINFGVVLENIILVALGASTGKFGFINSDYSIIQIVFVILVGIYSYMTSRTLNTNMAQKLDSLSRSQEETADLLKNISETAEKTEYGINDIYTDLTHLNEIAESTQTAMQDMLNGVNHTANAVQQQLSHTEAIQSQVDTADEAAASDYRKYGADTRCAFFRQQRNCSSGRKSRYFRSKRSGCG